MQREFFASPAPHPQTAAHVPVRRLCADGWQRDAVDVLVEETPVALVYNGISHAVMLATPTDLDDFALGFSLTEGLIAGPSDLLDVDVVPTELGIELQLSVTASSFQAMSDGGSSGR